MNANTSHMLIAVIAIAAVAGIFIAAVWTGTSLFAAFFFALIVVLFVGDYGSRGA